jgi:hypothetical protein
MERPNPLGLLSSSESEFTKPFEFKRYSLPGSQSKEEPDDVKVSSPVLEDQLRR